LRFCKECLVALFVFIVTTIGISLLGIGSNQIGIAQSEQPKINLTSAEKQHLLEVISFQIGNVTFTHHTATVNGIQLHYVMGGDSSKPTTGLMNNIRTILETLQRVLSYD
jgi:hypothetical protein